MNTHSFISVFWALSSQKISVVEPDRARKHRTGVQDELSLERCMRELQFKPKFATNECRFSIQKNACTGIPVAAIHPEGFRLGTVWTNQRHLPDHNRRGPQ